MQTQTQHKNIWSLLKGTCLPLIVTESAGIVNTAHVLTCSELSQDGPSEVQIEVQNSRSTAALHLNDIDVRMIENLRVNH